MIPQPARTHNSRRQTNPFNSPDDNMVDIPLQNLVPAPAPAPVSLPAAPAQARRSTPAPFDVLVRWAKDMWNRRHRYMIWQMRWVIAISTYISQLRKYILTHI